MPSCLTPLIILDKKRERSGATVAVPCGKCPHCVARRVSSWSFRLMQEEKRCSSAWFVTLTYDTRFVPITPSGFMSLDRPRKVLSVIKRGKKKGQMGFKSVSCHLQLFMKLLRKAHGRDGAKLTYYVCGEYGSARMRPHYHMILFNADVDKIQKCWKYGEIYYGSVSDLSVGYCLKYISKEKKIPVHGRDDRVPEFALMSKGIGSNYLTPAMVRWHLMDIENRMYCNLLDGKKCTMSRYYKDKIYKSWERKLASSSTLLRMMQERMLAELRYGEVFISQLELEGIVRDFRVMKAAAMKRADY